MGDGNQNFGPESDSPPHNSHRNSPSTIIEQEAPIDAVISVIEHDARVRKAQEKLMKKESSARHGSSTDTPKSKSKKMKRNRSDFSDLLPDLPSLNLSESDSSSDDGSDLDDPSAENSRHSFKTAAEEEEVIPTIAENVEAITTESTEKPMNQPADDDDDPNKAIPSESDGPSDIWENFKTYQANQMLDKALEDVEEDRLVAENIPIFLHVGQSDHDYSMMYKAISKQRSKMHVSLAESQQSSVAIPIIEEDDKGDIKITLMETVESTENMNLEPQSPAPLPASTITIDGASDNATTSATIANEKPTADSDSSSDSSGSDSDSSSCSCGSNCSCSSSSSSSSSSSDSGSDSSSSESKRKQRQKVLTKTRKSVERTAPMDENEGSSKVDAANRCDTAEMETIQTVEASANGEVT